MKIALNILLIANSNQIGGGNRSLETLSLGLKQAGHTPILVFPSEGPATELFRSHEIDVFVTPIIQPSIQNPLTILSGFLTWRRLLKNNNIDIVHTNGTLAARSMALAAKINKTPQICHIRFDFGKPYYEWAFRNLPSPQSFIFVSRSMQSNIEHILKKRSPKAKYHIVHNAVILSTKPMRSVTGKVNKIGIVANLQKIKGHEDFFNMARTLLNTYPNLHFDVIGTDVQNEGRETQLKKIVNDKLLNDNVTFHGHVSDVYSAIDELDLVICPSHEEPFGRCAIEAMSRGKPVIVTNVGGLPEIVENKKNGFVVPPKSPPALVEAVSILMKDKSLRQSISTNNIQKVEMSFSQKGHTDKILTLYQELLQ